MNDRQHPPSQRAAVPVRPAERYGELRPPWHRTAARVGVVLLAVTGVAWLVWAGIHFADRDVRWDDVGFRIVDSTRVDVTFDVIKSPDSTATCRLEALNGQYTVIGVATVEIGPGDTGHTRHTAPVTTQELAVTGIVKRCEIT